MSTRPVGTLYEDWRKAESGITALQQELARDQITHPLDLYQPGSERLEKLYTAMETAQRFSWPAHFTVNL